MWTHTHASTQASVSSDRSQVPDDTPLFPIVTRVTHSSVVGDEGFWIVFLVMCFSVLEFCVSQLECAGHDSGEQIILFPCSWFTRMKEEKAGDEINSFRDRDCSGK